jgi:hypothetical protein
LVNFDRGSLVGEAGGRRWKATYELLRPYPNQRQRVIYRRGEPPAS